MMVVVAVGAASMAHAQELAIVNARILPAPDAAPVLRGTVLVRDGRIAAMGDADGIVVPEGTAIIDGAGRTVVAGLWNSHIHLTAPPFDGPGGQPADVLSEALSSAYLHWGFTTVFDLASAPGTALALRARIGSGEVVGPQILTADAPFFPKDGVPSYVSGDAHDSLSLKQAEVATPEEATERGERQLRQGADGLKIFAGSIVGGEIGVLPMDVDIATAIVEVAHAAGKPVFAHPSNLEGIQVAFDSGADVLVHTTPMVGAWPEGLAARLVDRGMALVPSLKLFEIELQKEHAPPEAFESVLAAARQQLAAFSGAGGRVLFGTDAGYIAWYDTRDELRLMHEAGLDWRQILASLTTTPATLFGQGERKGRIAEGMDADLVVLGGDPGDDIAALADVLYTLREGKIVYRADSERQAHPSAD